MSGSDVEVLVIGAGAAGLAGARTLEAAGREVIVVDAGASAGGVMGTTQVDGYRVERGPNTMIVRAPALRFLKQAGAQDLLEKASPESRKRQLLHDGRLVDVPSSLSAFVRTGLLSGAAKRRLLAEPFVARGDATGESVADFVGRRLGPEVVSALVGPFLTGVYAGDERELGAEAVFPALVEFERNHGSIAAGAIANALRRRPPDERGLSGSYSARGGFGALAERLAAGLSTLRLETKVEALRSEAGEWVVSLRDSSGDAELRARSLLLATPALAASQLLASFASQAAQALADIRYAPIVAIGLGASPSELRSPVEGFGFLVPRAAGLGLLGCLFMSRLFADRAPAERVLLHCMLGGGRWPEAVELSDEELVKRACEDLDRSLGLRGEPQKLTLVRWPHAVAQPGVDHPRLVSSLRREVAGFGAIELAGSYLDGVSLADTFASGVAAAERLLAR